MITIDLYLFLQLSTQSDVHNSAVQIFDLLAKALLIEHVDYAIGECLIEGKSFLLHRFSHRTILTPFQFSLYISVSLMFIFLPDFPRVECHSHLASKINVCTLK